MLRYIKLLLGVGLISALFLLLPAFTSACGGFFCTNTPIDQGAERIIFTVNGDGTITAIVGINYVGAAADFSWVVPVPSPPALDVAETISIDTLAQATDMRFNNPPNPCPNLYFADIGMGGGGGGDYLVTGNVGPYDYAIIRNESPGEMVAWLRDNGYRITEDMEPIIAQYVEEEMYFLAMKLSQEAEVGDIVPVVMTYEDTEPMIPIRLTAVAAVPRMPILTWIFADSQYIPANYVHAEVDYSSFRGPHQVAGIGKTLTRYFGFSPVGQYNAQQNAIQDRYRGQAFITQFAGPTSTLSLGVVDPLLNDLIARFPYVTRLRAQMSPEEMTVDPYFVPSLDAPDVSNVVEMGRYVDPLEYWGCSSRTAIGDTMLANLPEGRTRIEALKMDVAHPTDWLLSEFDYEGYHFWVFSPQRISRNNVVTFLQQRDPIAPTLLMVQAGYPYMFSEWDTQRALMMSLGLTEDVTVPAPEGMLPVNARYWPYSVQYYDDDDENRPNIVMAVLAMPGDWEANEAIYRQMMAYAVSFQYYSHPELRHSLFLTDPEGYGWYSYGDAAFVPHLTVAYPEGWVEQTAAGDVLIMPEGTQDPQQGPMVRLTPIVRFVQDGYQQAFYEGSDFDLWADAAKWTIERYGLSPDLTLADLRGDACFGNYPVFPFQREGRTGTVRFTHRYIVELSMPEAETATYGSTMAMISDSVDSSAFSCG